MNLSTVFCSIQIALTINGWQSVIEDDLPDLNQLVCQKSVGPHDVFNRLDVLIMTSELNPIDASGICLCFLFYADPAKVVDMRKLGRITRQNNFQILRTQCESIFNSSGIFPGNPSTTILTHPKQVKIRFSNSNHSYPAFMVEFDYWMPREESSLAD